MRGLFYKLIDRSAIHLAAMSMPQPDGRDSRLAEALQLIERPDFISARVDPAKVQFADAGRIRFETPAPGPFAENNAVHGRLYRCCEKWESKPTVLLLHGWNDAINHYVRFPSLARQLNRNGFNAAALEAPFHFERRPRQLGAWSNFLCPDILRTADAVRQSVAETRSFAEWLRQQGCPAVGLVGVSLGGMLAGLTIAHDARFACAVLVVPAARLDRVLEEVAFCRHIRAAWQGERVATGKLNLTEVRPAIPKERILLVQATHDLFVPPETMEELWRVWEHPEMWRLPHGHISVIYAPGLHGRIIRWMAPRLDARAAK